MHQAREIARASFLNNFHYVVILGSVALYTLLILIVVGVLL